MTMQIAHQEVAPGKIVVTLSGRVMMGPASEQIVALVEELLRQGNRFVVFDLSGVTAIDSTGIGRFISSFNKLAAAGGEMRMAGATGHIFESFHVSLLDTVFSFYGGVEEALKA
jgi:anti-anti-sigma factor